VPWVELEKGYQVSSFPSSYGNVEQRWLLVFSEQAYKREEKTLKKKLEKQLNALEKSIWHLSNEIFSCLDDAKKAILAVAKNYRYHEVHYEIVPIERYAKRGKPKLTDEKKLIGYQIQGEVKRNEKTIELELNRKGRFILATNDLDTKNYPDAQMLEEYKGQQGVERGFRFIKDPWFMVDSIFLKSNKRIEALMMVMTLCLFVYNYSQHQLRERLRQKNETLPNQLGKEVQNPTMRWIFQLMEGIGVVRFYKNSIKTPFKEVLTNLNRLREKIIRLFGNGACQMYGLIQKNGSEVLGM